jgi:hypothetical protein
MRPPHLDLLDLVLERELEPRAEHALLVLRQLLARRIIVSDVELGVLGRHDLAAVELAHVLLCSSSCGHQQQRVNTRVSGQSARCS